MLLQAKGNKRALSIVIGYILLIAISIVMSIIVYQWLKTYVPKDTAKCSEGTSFFIKEISYNCTSKKLDITVKNNGKFSINGYFIHVSNSSNPDVLATIDISRNITDGGIVSGSSITFSDTIKNALTPEEPTNAKLCSFNIAGYSQLYKIEIIPTRMQEIDNKERLVSCGDAKVEETLSCKT